MADQGAQTNGEDNMQPTGEIQADEGQYPAEWWTQVSFHHSSGLNRVRYLKADSGAVNGQKLTAR